MLFFIIILLLFLASCFLVIYSLYNYMTGIVSYDEFITIFYLGGGVAAISVGVLSVGPKQFINSIKSSAGSTSKKVKLKKKLAIVSFKNALILTFICSFLVVLFPNYTGIIKKNGDNLYFRAGRSFLHSPPSKETLREKSSHLRLRNHAYNFESRIDYKLLLTELVLVSSLSGGIFFLRMRRQKKTEPEEN